jgi:enterobacteria phage integrase
MARLRSSVTKNLPTYLYAHQRNGKTYYSYRHPKTGKLHGMGSNKVAAIRAAQQLNAHFQSPDDANRVRSVLGGGRPFGDLLDRYQQTQAESNLSIITRRQRAWQVGVLRARWGEMAVADLTTPIIADFLAERPASMANVFRSLLLTILNQGIAEGWIEKNPVAVTQSRKAKVQRDRLSLEIYHVIYAQAVDYIQDSMQLSLLTLQRREDIVAMRFKDIVDGCLYVTQQKTKQQIRIRIEGELADLLDRIRRNAIPGAEHLIHLRKTVGPGKAGLPPCLDRISAGFQEARIRAGVGGESPPSFHEIRSLGARLYEKQGIDPQALLGHKSRQMVEKYLDSRGSDWTDATACLKSIV